MLARTDPDRATLAELQRRALANGVQASLIEGPEIRTVEPHAQGLQALYAPEGASFDAQRYVQTLAADAVSQRARFLYSVSVLSVNDPSLNGMTSSHVLVRTSIGDIAGEVVVNCAGLHADRLAGALAMDLRIVPFRGVYAELSPLKQGLVHSHVYPAPDLRFPFLGVHLSRRVDGRILVGPGAMLALGREAYRSTQVQWRDFADTLTWPGLYRLALRPGFLRLMGTEGLKSISLKRICAEACQLVPELSSSDLVWSFAGIRAQLVSRAGELVDDVLVRETPRVIHVLNAVSPGLTCSLPFGEELAVRSDAKLRGLTSHTENSVASTPSIQR